MKKVISIFCLITCALIWGTTFIAQDTGMDNIGPFTFNSVRFIVGFLAVSPFVFLFEKQKITDQIKNNSNQFIKLMLPVGVFLFLGCIFQQVSLLYTDVANSAFFYNFLCADGSDYCIFFIFGKTTLVYMALCVSVCHWWLFSK